MRGMTGPEVLADGKQEVRRLGGQGFLAKPFDDVALARVVSSGPCLRRGQRGICVDSVGATWLEGVRPPSTWM